MGNSKRLAGRFGVVLQARDRSKIGGMGGRVQHRRWEVADFRGAWGNAPLKDSPAGHVGPGKWQFIRHPLRKANPRSLALKAGSENGEDRPRCPRWTPAKAGASGGCRGQKPFSISAHIPPPIYLAILRRCDIMRASHWKKAKRKPKANGTRYEIGNEARFRLHRRQKGREKSLPGQDCGCPRKWKKGRSPEASTNGIEAPDLKEKTLPRWLLTRAGKGRESTYDGNNSLCANVA